MAERKANDLGIELKVFPGDAMQELPSAMRWALEIQDKGRVDQILVTAQAILHELPTRSTNFSLQRYFSEVYKADLVIGREPVEPMNWSTVVRLNGHFDADLFVRLANLIRKYLPSRFSDPIYTPYKVNDSSVRLHRALALETLTKTFYSEDFLYELQESVISFSSAQLEAELQDCLGPTHTIRTEDLTSDSVHSSWSKFEFEVKSDALSPLEESLIAIFGTPRSGRGLQPPHDPNLRAFEGRYGQILFP
jgi:hypothetical protein